MAILIVDDVTDTQDVVQLIAYLTQILADGETDDLVSQGTFTLTRGSTPTASHLADMVRLGQDEACTDPLHRAECSCVEDAADTDPRQRALLDEIRHEGPVPYLPCSRQGQHAALTDCWMCWSDVHRGAITVEQALMRTA